MNRYPGTASCPPPSAVSFTAHPQQHQQTPPTANADRREVILERLTKHMAGGADLAALKHELGQIRGVDTEELPEQ
jgi:hypothetical protein